VDDEINDDGDIDIDEVSYFLLITAILFIEE